MQAFDCVLCLGSGELELFFFFFQPSGFCVGVLTSFGELEVSGRTEFCLCEGIAYSTWLQNSCRFLLEFTGHNYRSL